MKQIFLAVIITACMPFHLLAQYTAPITWDAHPQIVKIPDSLKKYSSVIVLDERTIGYAIEGKDDIYQYRTSHTIAYLKDDKGIGEMNTVNIPIRSTSTIQDIKARAILPGGKVIEVAPASIKQMKNSEGEPEYAFAFEGLVKGCEVEYTYTEKRQASYFGVEFLQYGLPIMEARIVLQTPDRMKFDTKGYNGFPDATDTTDGDIRTYIAEWHNIPELKDEQYSNKDLYRMRFDFKLSYVNSAENERVRLFTWNELAKNMYESYCTFTDAEMKVVRRYISDFDFKSEDDDQKKAAMIENVIKKEIIISEDLTDDKYEHFETIVSAKTTTESSYIRFFCACLKAAGIDYRFGISPNRFKYDFDEKFENWKVMENYVIYVADADQYICPNAVTLRMPYLPLQVAGSTAVFCKVTTLGNATSAVAIFKKIPTLPMAASHSNITATVTFLDDMTPQIDLQHSLLGYSASGVRDYFLLVPKDKEKDLVTAIISLTEKPEDLISYTVAGAGFTNYTKNKPLELNVVIKTPQLIENAGPKFLFKVGDVIGRQEEMYNTEKRVMPIEIPYIHTLDRNITINIPDGYRIANPDDVKMDISDKTSKDPATCGFASTYTMDGKQMKITIHEYYSEFYYPASHIEPYRKVINAAADFNKVVLVLEKI